MIRGTIIGLTLAAVLAAIFLFANRKEVPRGLEPEIVVNIKLRGKGCPRVGTEFKGFSNINLGTGETKNISGGLTNIFGEGDLSDIPVGFRQSFENDESLELRLLRDDSPGRWNLRTVNGLKWKVTVSIEFTT